MKLIMQLGTLVAARWKISYNGMERADIIVLYQLEQVANMRRVFAAEIKASGKIPTFYVEGVQSKMNAATFEMNHQTKKAA